MLGDYLEVYSVFGYEPKQTEWGPRSRGPQTATLPPLILTKIDINFENEQTKLALLGRASKLTLPKEE